jgi:uncharacterized protein with FMN-binding domain
VKRAPIVITSTAAGVALLLSFHTSHPSLQIKSASGTSPGGSGSTPATTPQSTTPQSTTPQSSGSAPQSTGPTTTAPAPSNHSATGSDIRYRYGEIEIQVTASGSKITNVTILKDDATDGRSYQINSEAVPILQSETMSAQSSQIDGVSGATYTSQAYVQSLQAALDQLGIS